jgi:cell division septation protein DedD
VQGVSEGARSIWNEYRLLGESFRGPATVAWNAEHVISGRRARLTTVHAPPMASAVTAEAVSHAFRRTAERARDVTHADHLSIIGIAEQAGLPVAVTMLPEGAMLAERLTDRPVPLGEAMKRVSQIAHTVAALHGLTPAAAGPSGLRHGYLVPENLWLREDGRVALLDSGIHAAAAHAAFSSGFPLAPSPYVPPGDEAYAETNHGADVYALIALLVRLLTGRAPLPEQLPQAVGALPNILPASLRAELLEAATAPGSSTAPNARSLAVHLAFDSAWIRAQERTRGERDLLEGELLNGAPSDSEAMPHRSTDETPLRSWARAFPTAGVRGGSASPAPPEPPRSPAARAGQAVAGGFARLLSRRSQPAEAETNTPSVARYAVRLGPFEDAMAASSARARVRGSWPMAAVMAESGGYYVLVTACAGRARAEELVERLRQAGEPAEIGDI